MVLKGGAWCFDRTPVCLEIYDDIRPLVEVPMKHVRFWTRVTCIPPLYEEPDNLRLVGNLLGGFIDYDKKEFLRVLQAESLGLSENDMDSTLISSKRKVGKPLGQKNKVPRPLRTPAAPPLRITTPKFDRGKAGPNDRGNEAN
ncbi:hypothetical protein ACLB2K_055795 [Fragaria x ananassa]